VERCGVILHLIDGTQEDIAQAYQTIRHELEAYGCGLEDKKEIVGLNKCDALTEEEIQEKLAQLKSVVDHENIMVLSGATKQGVTSVLAKLLQFIQEHRLEAAHNPNADEPYHPLD
jgi:GTP-binding protein